MRIAIIGSRGIPAKYGGFETFCEKISVILSNGGHVVTVIGEKGNSSNAKKFDGVNICESAFRKSKNPVLFYWDSLFKTRKRFDVVIVCGVGAALFYPLLKKGKTTLVTNVDGLEHLRGKFRFLKKLYVRLAQIAAGKWSDFIVVDSDGIGEYWKKNYKGIVEKIRMLAYGADQVTFVQVDGLQSFGLIEGTYYLVIARLVPENHIREIIEGFLLSGSSKSLVIVGGLEDNSYVRALKSQQSKGILFTDAIYDKNKLDSLRKGAFAYIHGHSVGGTNPSLLEAMACSCVCICHDNIFNREVTNQEQLYFRNKKHLSLQLAQMENMASSDLNNYKNKSLARVQSAYSWEKIGNQYLQFLKFINERKHSL